MSLPPPDKNGYGPWNEYRIDTPAFRLTALEKPDMSPYLVHMTGQEAIHGILNSGTEGKGKIVATVPQQSKARWYDSPVVCFTESPLFAIDAFRYIKFQRWQQDMRYGLGFSKEALVKRGSRPVIYADSNLVTSIKKLRDLLGESELSPLRECSQSILTEILPLMNSLMEYEPKQGFIWEREWRHPDPDGFIFGYCDIEIICCPDDERESIAKLLGSHSKNIVFVNSWSQYDDVRAFLNSRANGWETRVERGMASQQDLVKLRDQYKQERNKLQAYRAYVDRVLGEIGLIEASNALLDIKIDELSALLDSSIENEHCCNCGCALDVEEPGILWNEDEGDIMCSGCHGDFLRKCVSDD